MLAAGVALLPELEDAVLLAARQLEPGVVAGEQEGVAGRGEQGHLDVVPAVRTGPSVEAAVPLAVEVLPDGAGVADVVGDHPVVGTGALHPGAGVLDRPVAVPLLAGEEKGVRRQGGLGDVVDDVPPFPAVVNGAAHLQRLGVILGVPPGGDAGQVVERNAVALASPVQGVALRVVAVAGTAGAVDRRQDDPLLRVVVPDRGIVAGVEAGELARPEAQAAVGRIGEAEVVEEGVALGDVEDVLGLVVLVLDRAAAGQLPRHSLPAAVGELDQVGTAPHQVEQGPVEVRLVVVVRAAAAPGVVPDELAVVAHVAVDEGVDALLHRRHQVALLHRPGGGAGHRHGGADRFQVRSSGLERGEMAPLFSSGPQSIPYTTPLKPDGK